MNSYKIYFKPKTYDAGKATVGLSLEKALVEFVLAKGLATNPSGDCCTLIPTCCEGSSGGATNLTLTRTSTNVTINSSTGTDVTIPSASTTDSGVMTATDKVKLDSLANYVHPNHSGDVTSVSGGVTTIQPNVVTNTKLADMPANAVKVNSTNGAGDPSDLVLSTNQLLGRGSGNISPIVLGTNLSISGNTLNAAGGSGLTDGDKGDIIVSGGGNVMSIDVNTVDNAKLADMPGFTIKGNNNGVAADPKNLTVAETQNLLSINDLIFLSGIPEGSVNLGTFVSTLSPNLTIKQALEEIAAFLNTGDSVINGLTGNGSSLTPHKLGGPLTESTTILGNGYSFRVEKTGQIFLECDTASGTNISELVLTPSNVIGAYMRTRDKINPNKQMSMGFDLDSTVGYGYKTGSGTEEVGFFITPSSTLAGSKVVIKTANVSAGTATAGQLPVLQPDGSIEFQTITTGTTDTVYVNNGATIVASNTGVTFVRNTAAVWTINVPSGVELKSVDIYSQTSENPGGNVTININTTSTIFNQGVSSLRIPTINGLNLGAGVGSLPATYAPTTGSTNLFPQVVSVGSGDIQILINNYNNASGLGTGATTLKLLW